MLINIGEAYIVVNLLPEGVDDEGPHHTMRLKIFGGSNNGEVYEFSVAEMNKGHREIVMGRTPDCDIRINDKLLSKAQCHMKLWYESQDHYRWLLHEFLVSVFAQQLKTAEKVSPQRLDRAWEDVAQEA